MCLVYNYIPRITYSVFSVAAAPGVVADFYLRFHNRGKHLTKLSAEIKTGKLGTHPVSKKFVRACKYNKNRLSM